MNVEKIELLSRTRDWFQGDAHESVIRAEQILETYHSMHPRSVFIKTLPRNATILDMGAGDDSLDVFRHWPAPARPDLELYGYSLEKGSKFDELNGYEIGDWNDGPPDFGGMKFDAIYSSHFIEHIGSSKKFIKWCASRLVKGGRIYIEWPSENSLTAPSINYLQNVGFPKITANFYDDKTHRKLPKRKKVIRQLRKNGLPVIAQATIWMPLFEDALLEHYRATNDVVSLQFAYWLRTGWCQYVIACSLVNQA